MTTWIGRLFPYVGHLEREVARLQDRERKLLNVILPRVGCDPLDVPDIDDRKPVKERKGKQSRLQSALAKIRARRKQTTYVPDIRSEQRPAAETDGQQQ